MSDITLSVNVNEVNRLIGKYKHDALLDCGKVMRFEMGSIGASLVKYTPPSQKFSKGSGSDRDIGERAIIKDLSRIFTPIEDSDLFNDLNHVKKYYPGMEIGKNKSAMQQWHLSHRRNGSVRHRSTVIGKFRAMDIRNKMYVRQSRWNSYTKEVQKHVGKLKAGWLPMVSLFGGKMPQTWITRHAPNGSAIDALGKYFTGKLIGINRTPYVKIIERKGIEWFVSNMHRKMLADKLKRVIGNAARYYNAQRARSMQKAA